jgi:hypothetical protein
MGDLFFVVFFFWLRRPIRESGAWHAAARVPTLVERGGYKKRLGHVWIASANSLHVTNVCSAFLNHF